MALPSNKIEKLMYKLLIVAALVLSACDTMAPKDASMAHDTMAPMAPMAEDGAMMDHTMAPEAGN